MSFIIKQNFLKVFHKAPNAFIKFIAIISIIITIIICLLFLKTHHRPILPGTHEYQFEGTLSNLPGYDFDMNFKTRYLIFAPREKLSNGRLPLILYLHEAAERSSDLELLRESKIIRLIENQSNLNALVVIPLCPPLVAWNPDKLHMLLDDLIENLPIDRNRVYVTGIGMGGRGAWELAINYPAYFSGVAPICGLPDNHSTEDIKKYSPTFKRIPIMTLVCDGNRYATREAIEEYVKQVNEVAGSATISYSNSTFEKILEDENQINGVLTWLLKQHKGSDN